MSPGRRGCKLFAGGCVILLLYTQRKYFKILIPCSFSLCWPLLLLLQQKEPFSPFWEYMKGGAGEAFSSRGWIYNFILTWLILHREVFVQEAACLIMAQLCLTESKHGARVCREEPLWHVTQTAHMGDVIVAQISWCLAHIWLSEVGLSVCPAGNNAAAIWDSASIKPQQGSAVPFLIFMFSRLRMSYQHIMIPMTSLTICPQLLYC